MKQSPKKTKIIQSVLILILLVLFCSCGTRITEQELTDVQAETEQFEIGDYEEPEVSSADRDAVRTESQSETVSIAEIGITSSAANVSSKVESADPVESENKQSPTETAETHSVVPTPTSKPTPIPTTKPTAKPTAVPTTAPTVTPSSIPTATPTVTPTPSVKPTSMPAPKKVWVVDVPGHYETVESEKEVWIDEEGHWSEDGYWASDWVYQCNQCGAQYPTKEAVNKHIDDSFDWDTMTGHSSYTQVSGPTYWVETDPVWVVDVPGHYETVTETKEVWVEEQGHWETIKN